MDDWKQHTGLPQFLIAAVQDQLRRMLPATRDQADGRSEMTLRERVAARHVRRIDGRADVIERHRSGRWAVRIKPPEFRDEDPEMPPQRVMRAIYGDFPRLSWEITEVDGRIVYRAIVFSESDANHLTNRILNLTDCSAEIVERPPLPGDKGDFAEISTIRYKEDQLFPIKHPESKDSVQPYRQLLDTLAGEWDGQTTIQTIIEPAGNWTTRWSRGTPHNPTWRRRAINGDYLREDRRPATVLAAFVTAAIGWAGHIHWAELSGMLGVIGQIIVATIATWVIAALWICATVGDGFLPLRVTAARAAEWQRSKPWAESNASSTERADVDAIARQGESPSWRVTMRVMTTAPDRRTAHGYHQRVVQSLRNGWHNRATGQRLVGRTVKRKWKFDRMLKKIAQRRPHRSRRERWRQKLTMAATRPWPVYMADFELASLVQWPDRTAGAASVIEYSSGKSADPDAKASEFNGFEDAEPDPKPIEEGEGTQPDPQPTESEPDPIEREVFER